MLSISGSAELNCVATHFMELLGLNIQLDYLRTSWVDGNSKINCLRTVAV